MDGGHTIKPKRPTGYTRLDPCATNQLSSPILLVTSTSDPYSNQAVKKPQIASISPRLRKSPQQTAATPGREPVKGIDRKGGVT